MDRQQRFLASGIGVLRDSGTGGKGLRAFLSLTLDLFEFVGMDLFPNGTRAHGIPTGEL